MVLSALVFIGVVGGKDAEEDGAEIPFGLAFFINSLS